MRNPEQSTAGPRVIVGVSRAQEERAFGLGGKAHAITTPPQARLVVVDLFREEPDPLLASLIDDDALKPGVVLVRSPFHPERYANEKEAELVFEREKLHLFSELCKLLGATRVTSDSGSLLVQQKEATAKAKVEAKIAKTLGKLSPLQAQTSVSFDELQEWKSRLGIDDAYPGGPPDIAAAHEFLQRHGLKDPEIRSLVEARTGQNPLKERTLTLSYEGRKDKNLNLAAEVRLPTAVVEGQFRRDYSTRHRVELTLHVEFPD